MKKRIGLCTILLLLVSALLCESAWAALPERYDSRDAGYVTPVREQGYGSCWAHTVIACIETYMIKYGITDPTTGKPADHSLDLSELHLAWFSYDGGHDEKGMLEGDRVTLQNTDDFNWIFLNRGGDALLAAATMMRWEGPAAESEEPLKYENAWEYQKKGLPEEYAYRYDAAHLSGAVCVEGNKTEELKRLITEYGAAYATLYHRPQYEKENGAYCFVQSAKPGESEFLYGNHSVAVVGWDDHYSRMNFKEENRPTKDGAWIAKNSYGTDKGDNGYLYISYEDSSIKSGFWAFFRVDEKDRYEHIYQYDGVSFTGGGHAFETGEATVANVFTADAYERLEAVSVRTGNADLSYDLTVYTGLSDPKDPTSGQIAYEGSGVFPYYGYMTVPLEEKIPLLPGTRFSVVFRFRRTDESRTLVLPSCYSGTGSNVKWVHASHPQTSFYLDETDREWKEEQGGEGNFYIKAYTNDVEHIWCSTQKVCRIGEQASVLLCEPEETVLSACVLEGALPPGMKLKTSGHAVSLEGTPETRGEYTGTVAVNTAEEVLFCKYSVLEAEEAVEESPLVLRVRTGDEISIPLYNGFGGGWRQVIERRSALPEGIRISLENDKPPTLEGCPQKEEYVKTEYEIVFSDGSARRRKIEWIVYEPEHAFLGNPNPFSDISPADEAYLAVMWAYYHVPQIAEGTSTDTFSPQNTVTRGQAVTFLWRANGCPTVHEAQKVFADVPEDAYYKDAVYWAANRGITHGTGEDTFLPEDTLTTRHIITFLYRSCLPGKDGWEGEANAWAAEEGLEANGAAPLFDDTPCLRKYVVKWIYEIEQ